MVRGSGTGSWSLPALFLAGSRPWRSRSVLRGESTTTYASSKLNRVGRRAARYDSGLSAHRCNRPAHKRLTPHRIAYGQIACSRSRCGNLTTLHFSPVTSHSQTLAGQPTLQHNHARYDAFGRMVEQKRGSTYTQIAYSPTGQKLSLMSGSTLQKAMVPLSGQAQAVYNSSGLLYYAHPDLLGSIRLATTPTTRVMYFDTAYAPFGETYASAGGTSLDPAYTGQMADTAHRQDTAGGLYDFPVREYSIQGRWPSPDPAGISSTCPNDPQTQNRYAYVRNNPITYTDPTGMDGACEDDPFCGDPCPWWDFWGDRFGPVGGGGGGGGGPVERPRPFPWPLLPLGLFLRLERSHMRA